MTSPQGVRGELMTRTTGDGDDDDDVQVQVMMTEDSGKCSAETDEEDRRCFGRCWVVVGVVTPHHIYGNDPRRQVVWRPHSLSAFDQVGVGWGPLQLLVVARRESGREAGQALLHRVCTVLLLPYI
ncbi:hypothetical protein F2P79_025627 [Pimephales promelas]|nr:hypothetical protein F2P79_025627 [Pimephales promelas]